MSIDVDSLSIQDTDACFSYVNWALETGVWDGRVVSWLEASDFTDEMEQRIASLLFSQDPNGVDFYKMAAQFAFIGSRPEDREGLQEALRKWGFTPHGMIIPAGFGKSFSKFWSKHKVAILVGVGVVAAVTTVAIIGFCAAGAAAGVAAGAAINKSDASKKGREPPVAGNSLCAKAEPDLVKPQTPEFLTPVIGQKEFFDDRVLVDDRYQTYNDWLKRSQFDDRSFAPGRKEALVPEFPSVHSSMETLQDEKSWLYWALESIGIEVMFGESDMAYAHPFALQGSKNILDPSGQTRAWQSSGSDPVYIKPYAELPPSSKSFTTEGLRPSHLRIGGINGMNTSFSDAKSHAAYLSRFTAANSVDWIHNHSNNAIVDVAETMFLNYNGVSPNTGALLKENWIAFHEENRENPHAKYLQFCHSQGAIHVRNELQMLPVEIRDRIIVVAIAPAAIVPKDICYDSFNYASKSDVVYLGELLFAYSVGQDEAGRSELVSATYEKQNQLVLLDPHPDAEGMDHGFQSPTFKDVIMKHIYNYCSSGGEYK